MVLKDNSAEKNKKGRNSLAHKAAREFDLKFFLPTFSFKKK
jgi:hypothetical protein